jgi:hypothetical protein
MAYWPTMARRVQLAHRWLTPRARRLAVRRYHPTNLRHCKRSQSYRSCINVLQNAPDMVDAVFNSLREKLVAVGENCPAIESYQPLGGFSSSRGFTRS